MIFDALIVSLPQLINVGGLLFIVLYIYAILGVQLFATIKQNGAIDDRWNFQSFPQAFLVLIRMATGEDWQDLMASVKKPFSITYQCDENYSLEKYIQLGYPNQCGNYYAFVFFLTYNLFVMIIFVNLFIAIVLQSYDEMNKNEFKLLKPENMQKLRNCWAEFDPEGTFFIEINQLVPFLTLLGEPLGFSEQEIKEQRAQSNFLKNLELPTYNQLKNYYYYDVIIILVQNAFMKIEFQKILNQQLMDHVNKNDVVSVQTINNIKEELNFQSIQNKVKLKDIIAFKEARSKEKNLYKKVIYYKDDEMTQQHLWAGNKIQANHNRAPSMNFSSKLIFKKQSEPFIIHPNQESHENDPVQEENKQGSGVGTNTNQNKSRRSSWLSFQKEFGFGMPEQNLEFGTLGMTKDQSTNPAYIRRITSNNLSPYQIHKDSDQKKKKFTFTSGSLHGVIKDVVGKDLEIIEDKLESENSDSEESKQQSLNRSLRKNNFLDYEVESKSRSIRSSNNALNDSLIKNSKQDYDEMEKYLKQVQSEEESISAKST